MRVGVIGCGYLGSTTAACLADMGHEVIATDVSQARIDTLSSGTSPIFEPGLEELLGTGLASGRLRFTTDIAQVAAHSEVVFLCVGTPQLPGELGTDMSQVNSAAEALFLLLTNAVVVGKSTVPVGTAARLRSRLHELSPDSTLVWSPEFLREGHAIVDTVEPDRIVIGAAEGERRGIDAVRAVFSAQIAAQTPVVECDLATAELVKISANAFLATKISFINAMSEVCDAAGADVLKLAQALGYDERIGAKFLRPGLGYGGGCLPKDVRALFARGSEIGAAQAVAFLDEVDAINKRCRERVVELTTKSLGRPLVGATIAALGAAFKPNTDDTRDSPALDVAGRLHLAGATVRVYDPVAMSNARRERPTLTYTESAQAACAGADIVLLLTEWQEFVHLNPTQLGELIGARVVVDARHVLDQKEWSAAGWTYRAPGVPLS